MRARLAFTTALVALLTSVAAPADPVDAPAAEFIVSSAAPGDDLPPHIGMLPDVPASLPSVRDLQEPIPYRFECVVSRWVDGRQTTWTRLLEGEVGDEPVHFGQDGYFLRDDGPVERQGFSCTIAIGRGPFEISRIPSPQTVVPTIGTIGFFAGGRTSRRGPDGKDIAVSGIKFVRGPILSGVRILWKDEWLPRDDGSEGWLYSNDSWCVTLVRGWDLERASDFDCPGSREVPEWANRIRPTPHTEHREEASMSPLPIRIPDLIPDASTVAPSPAEEAAAGVPLQRSNPVERAASAIATAVPRVKTIGAGEEI